MSTQLKEAPAPRRKRFSGPEHRSGGLSLGKIFGLEVTLDPSWLFIFALITLSLFGSLVRDFPGLPVTRYWIGAVSASLVFFACLLFHELSHSWVAQARGIEVHGITLFFFGGVSRLREEPTKPFDEFLMALVGPLASGLLGLLLMGGKLLLPPGTLIAGLVGWLGFVNLALAAFNLLPGFPLDGGRVLRAAAWGVTGNFAKATRIAAGAGMGIAYLLILSGLVQAVFFDRVMNGLWVGFIGWFLLTAAQRSVVRLNYDRVLDQLRVGAVMKTDLIRVSPDETVERFVQEHVLRIGERCQLVTDDSGNLLGLVTLHEVKHVPRDAWPVTPLHEVMIPWERLRTTEPGDSLLDALDLMNSWGIHQLPVVEGTTLRGVVRRQDLLRHLTVHLEVGKAR